MVWSRDAGSYLNITTRALPPANEVCEGYVFTGVYLSTPGGGLCGFILGGLHGFYFGGMYGFIWGEGVHGFIWGACMVLFGGHAWFYSGGVHGLIRGVCVVLFGGMCMVLFGGCAWFYLGGVYGFSGGVCMVFFSFFGYNEIRSMSGRYASYWNASSSIGVATHFWSDSLGALGTSQTLG